MLFVLQSMCQSYCSPVSAGAASSLVVSPHVSFGPVRKAISDLKEQLQSLYHREFPNITSAGLLHSFKYHTRFSYSHIRMNNDNRCPAFTVKTVNILQMEKANKGKCIFLPNFITSPGWFTVSNQKNILHLVSTATSCFNWFHFGFWSTLIK